MNAHGLTPLYTSFHCSLRRQERAADHRLLNSFSPAMKAELVSPIAVPPTVEQSVNSWRFACPLYDIDINVALCCTIRYLFTSVLKLEFAKDTILVSGRVVVVHCDNCLLIYLLSHWYPKMLISYSSSVDEYKVEQVVPSVARIDIS